MSKEDMQHRFAFHPADTEEKQKLHESVRFLCGSVAKRLDEILPEGREKSLAITKLEEAMYWSNAAIARDQ